MTNLAAPRTGDWRFDRGFRRVAEQTSPCNLAVLRRGFGLAIERKDAAARVRRPWRKQTNNQKGGSQ